MEKNFRPLRHAAMGAGLMYVLDPIAGRRRRSLLRAQLFHLGKISLDLLAKSSRDFNHRARGRLYETKSRFTIEHVPDEILVERVRSKLGRLLSHPHAIKVEAHQGMVVLRGPILAEQVDPLLHGVAHVRGVVTVRNALEIHSTTDNIPALQGGPPHSRGVPRWLSPPRLLGTTIALALTGASIAYARRRNFIGTGLCLSTLGIFLRGPDKRRPPVVRLHHRQTETREKPEVDRFTYTRMSRMFTHH